MKRTFVAKIIKDVEPTIEGNITVRAKSFKKALKKVIYKTSKIGKYYRILAMKEEID